jgi:hypothetical protein
MKLVKIFILLALLAVTLSKVKRNRRHRHHHRSHSGEITPVANIGNVSFKLGGGATYKLKSVGQVAESKTLCFEFDEFSLTYGDQMISRLHELCKYDQNKHYFCTDADKYDLNYECKKDLEKKNLSLHLHVIDKSNKAEKFKIELRYQDKLGDPTFRKNFFTLINSKLSDDKGKCEPEKDL